MAFDIGSIKGSLELDRTKFNASLAAAEKDAREFTSGDWVAALDLDLFKFEEELKEAQAQLAALGDETIKLKVEADDAAIKETQARLKAIQDEKVELEVEPDTSSMSAADARIAAWKTKIEADKVEPEVKPDLGPMIDQIAAAKIIAEAAERGMAMEPKIDPDIKPWLQKSAFVKRDANLIKKLDPTVVFEAINDPLAFVARQSMGLVKNVTSMDGTVTFKSRGGKTVQKDAEVVEKAIEGMFDALAKVENISGRDGSLTRSMGSAIAKIVTMGSSAVGTATDVAQLAAAAGDAANGGGGGGGMLGLAGGAGAAAGKIAMMGVSAGITAASLGILAAAIMPIFAILATGVATIAAVGMGFGLMGAAAFGVAKDYGAVSTATRAVENAQIKLKEAQKAAGEESKKLAPITKELTEAEKAQKTAKDQLSKAWDRLEQARNPNNTKAIASAEKEITELEKQQKNAANATSAAWDKLSKARDAKDTKAIAAAEGDISQIQKKQQGTTNALDSAWAKLTQARKSGNTKEAAKWEGEIARLQKEEKKTSDQLSAAFDNLDKARDAGKPKAIAAAEKQLAEAQKKEEGITKALDAAHSKLDKTRNPKNAKAVADAEKDIAKWEAEVEKTTSAVEKAQKKLNEARKSGSSARVKIAEKELAAAQNDQALALKRASGNSVEYRNALKSLHAEGKKLGPTFQSAFNDAKVQAAQMTTLMLRWTNKQLPMLGKAADDSLEQFETGFKKGYDEAKPFESVIKKLPPIMGDLGGVTKNTGSAFNSFMEVAMPYVKSFTQWLEDASERLASWADSKQGRDDIKAFLDLAVPLAKEFGEFLKEVLGHLFNLAKEHGPAVVAAIDLISEAVDVLVTALDAALTIAKPLLETLAAIGKKQPGGAKGQAKNLNTIQHAHGGDQHAFAGGGDEIKGKNPLAVASHGLAEVGAHYVTGPTSGQIGDQGVLYGEALSGSSREYAFPLGGGSYRFITEQPGFDDNSYALWKDLGHRKGYLRGTGMNAMPPQHRTGMPSLPRIPGGAARADSGPGAAQAIAQVGSAIVGAVERNTEATEAVPEGVKESTAHNLAHGRHTRTNAMKGLSRETRRRLFEGSL